MACISDDACKTQCIMNILLASQVPTPILHVGNACFKALFHYIKLTYLLNAFFHQTLPLFRKFEIFFFVICNLGNK